MKSNILKALTNNLIFKILAFLFAFTLWLIVYNMEDPTKTNTMTLQVSYINKESVVDMNKYYEVVEGTGKVTFSVTAPRSVLEKLEETDFAAIADMEYLQPSEDGASGTVPIEIRCTNTNLAKEVKLSTTKRTLQVKLEDLMSKQFIITPNAIGEVAEGYALGSVTINAPNVLKVSGPESLVKTVESVVATIDVGNMSMNVTDSVLPKLLNKEGKEIDTTRLTLSNTTVNISANILRTKEVPITIKPSGKPADGYTVNAISSDPTTIWLKGSSSALNSISAIEIPAELISVQDANTDVTATIDITEYLPYGVELVDKNDADIDITIEIAKIREKVFSVATTDIMVTGLPTDTKYRFVHASVAVTISGLEADVALLNNAIISGSIDVTGLAEGEHHLPLTLDIDRTKYTYPEVMVSIIIGDDPVTEPGTDVTDDTETSGEPGTENPGNGNTSDEPEE